MKNIIGKLLLVSILLYSIVFSSCSKDKENLRYFKVYFTNDYPIEYTLITPTDTTSFIVRESSSESTLMGPYKAEDGYIEIKNLHFTDTYRSGRVSINIYRQLNDEPLSSLFDFSENLSPNTYKYINVHWSTGGGNSGSSASAYPSKK